MRVRSIVALSVLAVGAGCATEPPRATTDELARAQALIGEAEQSGAQQYAPADLQQAHDKLATATQLQSKQPVEAEQLAKEAALDAQLATARTSDGKTQRAVHDVNENLDTLRNEELRHQGAPPPASQVPPPPQAILPPVQSPE
jgi:phage tail tape-measure protein